MHIFGSNKKRCKQCIIPDYVDLFPKASLIKRPFTAGHTISGTDDMHQPECLQERTLRDRFLSAGPLFHCRIVSAFPWQVLGAEHHLGGFDRNRGLKSGGAARAQQRRSRARTAPPRRSSSSLQQLAINKPQLIEYFP